jgi:hypothetical protein
MLTKEELILQLKESRTNQATRDRVITDLLPVALAIAKGFGNRFRWYREEARSLALIGLICAIDNVPLDHPEPLAYIRAKITGDVRMGLRSERFEKDRLTKVAKKNYTKGTPLYDVTDFGRNDYEKQLIKLRVDGYTIDEICVMLHRRKAGVCQDLKEMVAWLHEKLE